MEYILRSNEIFPEGGRRRLMVNLWKQDRNVFSMDYDVLLHTARLESNGTRRLFMVYDEGKRHPKTVFKNEYGFDAGYIDPALAEDGLGTIVLLEKSYFFNLDSAQSGRLSVYKNAAEQPAISFAVDVASVGTIATKADNQLPADYFNCLLFGVCWYLQLPAKSFDLINTGVLKQEGQMMRR